MSRTNFGSAVLTCSRSTDFKSILHLCICGLRCLLQNTWPHVHCISLSAICNFIRHSPHRLFFISSFMCKNYCMMMVTVIVYQWLLLLRIFLEFLAAHFLTSLLRCSVEIFLSAVSIISFFLASVHAPLPCKV